MSRNTKIVLFVYCCLTLSSMFFHEQWRDEMEEFSICLNSSSFLDFLQNRQTTAHPILWQLIIFLSTRVSSSFLPIQIINIFCIILVQYYILKNFKLNLLQSIAICFSYLFFFEYSVIARSYSLELLMVILSVINFEKRNIKKGLIFAILAPHTNIFGAILIIAAVFYYWSTNHISFKRSLLVLGSVMIAGLDVFYQTFFVWKHEVERSFDILFTSDKIFLLLRAFLPLPKLQTFFWNTFLLDINSVYAVLASAILTGVIIILMIFFFKKEMKMLLSILFVWAVLALLFAFFWDGSQRHWSHYYIVVLMFLLIQLNKNNIRGFTKNLFTMLLFLQLPVGLYAYYMDLRYPFSSSKEVANYLDANYDQDKIILTGSKDYTIMPVANQMIPRTKYYSYQSEKLESYVSWNRPEFSNSFLLPDLLSDLSKAKQILSINSNLYPGTIYSSKFFELTQHYSPVSYKKKIEFNNAIVEDENYSIYEVDLTSEKSFTQKLLIKPTLLNNTGEGYIDDYTEDDNTITLKGWCTITNCSSVKEKYLYIEGTEKYISLMQTECREDLKTITLCEENLYSGFYAQVDKQELVKGIYNLSVIIPDGKDAYHQIPFLKNFEVK